VNQDIPEIDDYETLYSRSLEALRHRIGRHLGNDLKRDNYSLRKILEAADLPPDEVPDEFIALLIRENWHSVSGFKVGEASRRVVGEWDRIRPPDKLLGTESVTLENTTVLGGTGYPLSQGRTVSVTFDKEDLAIAATNTTIRIAYEKIESIDLSGGTQATGGGFIGGGFGLEGAAIGIFAASALNALTTSTTTWTVLGIVTDDGELFLHYDQAEPGALRILLSHAFTAVRRARKTD